MDKQDSVQGSPMKAKQFSLNDGTKTGVLSKKARNQHGFNIMNPWAGMLRSYCTVMLEQPFAGFLRPRSFFFF